MSPIILAIGSTNIVKIDAVKEVIAHYPLFSSASIHTFNVSSEVSDQPFGLEEMILGAKNRAKNAFQACQSCTYSFGIESGLMDAPGTQTGFLEACICSVFDGVNFSIGLSCGFEIPPQILHFVLDKNMELSQACFQSGITKNAKLGSAEGLIGLLTKGRIPRKEYTKQCVMTALIQLENIELYQSSVNANLQNR